MCADVLVSQTLPAEFTCMSLFLFLRSLHVFSMCFCVLFINQPVSYIFTVLTNIFCLPLLFCPGVFASYFCRVLCFSDFLVFISSVSLCLCSRLNVEVPVKYIYLWALAWGFTASESHVLSYCLQSICCFWFAVPVSPPPLCSSSAGSMLNPEHMCILASYGCS